MSGYPPPLPMQKIPPPSGAFPPPRPGYGPPPATQYAPPPAQYAASPAQYAAPPAQYAAPPSQYAARPAQYAPPPTQYLAPPPESMFAPPNMYGPPPPGNYIPPTGRFAAPPLPPSRLAPPSGAYAIREVLNPPKPFTPPTLDSSVSSKFSFQNNSLRGSERNFTAEIGASVEDVKQFFQSNSGVPQFKVKVIGWHMQKDIQKNSDGTEREVQSRKEDWDVTVDVSKWLQAPGTISGMDDAVSSFMRSSKSLRKVTLHKRVNFDLGAFLGEVKRIVGERGWTEQTEAKIVWADHSEKLTLHGAGKCHNVCDSTCCKILTYITCTWICWLPMKCLCFEDDYTFHQDMNLSISSNQFALAVQNDLPRSFRGLEAQINAQRAEERREFGEYEREQQRKEEEAEERKWQQEQQQQQQNNAVTWDFQVQQADGTVVNEEITFR